MNSEHSLNITDFLLETNQYIEQLDSLSFYAAADLYDLYDDAARTSTSFINDIDPELRVTICDLQDKVLDRIIDVLPSYNDFGKDLKIFSPSLDSYKVWYNFHLMKDCGLAGYLLAKEIGAKSVMFFGSTDENYPFLSVLPGLELLYRKPDDDPEQSYVQHLVDHYSDMDILILYGMYKNSTGYLDAYRLARPDGKVYCGIDLKTYWMKSIDWRDESLVKFTHQCDVIATSCRLMRDVLNRTQAVQFPCRWLANGFYNPTNVKTITDAKYKENVILTVGRIGSPEKNNEELLSAFVTVTEFLPGWTLRLVGPVEDRLQPFLDWYFSTYPKMKDRVIFTGIINDKKELYDEYAKANVFVLTSRSESGTPNVYAEALFHGCIFITSGIDGADDITNYGELGVKYERDNIASLAEALIKVCYFADEQGMQEHIPKALAYAKKYYDWERNAKKIAYMLFK